MWAYGHCKMHCGQVAIARCPIIGQGPSCNYMNARIPGPRKSFSDTCFQVIVSLGMIPCNTKRNLRIFVQPTCIGKQRVHVSFLCATALVPITCTMLGVMVMTFVITCANM